MTDHDRARLFYGFACVLSGAKPHPRSARPWLARILGITPSTAQRWGEDNWPAKARAILDAMAQVHPLQWPTNWRI